MIQSVAEAWHLLDPRCQMGMNISPQVLCQINLTSTQR
uniref:Uncharacterized protein n=1 Tax=Arundo donax TaxID=35708 RepID=A0A0A9AVX1_ARUDO